MYFESESHFVMFVVPVYSMVSLFHVCPVARTLYPFRQKFHEDLTVKVFDFFYDLQTKTH